MILADTSVWIDHLRLGIEPLTAVLLRNEVYIHPMVVGELACGTLKNREIFLQQLNRLPKVTAVSHDEMMHFIEACGLMGKGIGYVDIHLLAACRLTPACKLWSYDKCLAQVAKTLDVAFMA